MRLVVIMSLALPLATPMAFGQEPNSVPHAAAPSRSQREAPAQRSQQSQVAVQLKVVHVAITKARQLGIQLDLTGDADETRKNVRPAGNSQLFRVDDTRADRLVKTLCDQSAAAVLYGSRLVIPSGKKETIRAGKEISGAMSLPDGSVAMGHARGVEVALAPAVSGDKVELSLYAEVREPNCAIQVPVGKASMPIISKIGFSAHSQLERGQTLVLRGPSQTHMEAEMGGVPVLGEPPVAGRVFRNVPEFRAETAVFVLARTEIIQPSTAALPARARR